MADSYLSSHGECSSSLADHPIGYRWLKRATPVLYVRRIVFGPLIDLLAKGSGYTPIVK
ncbi:hypothetical protein LZ32DRAFT_611520 [Colletotrichum eremochloae]|nr:hypothetical protein LZ32DRAFT_611520 [Colletotrichum eremochloae]